MRDIFGELMEVARVTGGGLLTPRLWVPVPAILAMQGGPIVLAVVTVTGPWARVRLGRLFSVLI